MALKAPRFVTIEALRGKMRVLLKYTYYESNLEMGIGPKASERMDDVRTARTRIP